MPVNMPRILCDPINIVNQQSISETTNTIFNDIILSEGTVRSVLRNLDNNKAHGPDEIPARVLTETAYQIAPSLYLLFNKSLKNGIVPREWKRALVSSTVNLVKIKLQWRYNSLIPESPVVGTLVHDPKLLKKIARGISTSLTRLYNECIQLCKWLSHWNIG